MGVLGRIFLIETPQVQVGPGEARSGGDRYSEVGLRLSIVALLSFDHTEQVAKTGVSRINAQRAGQLAPRCREVALLDELLGVCKGLGKRA